MSPASTRNPRRGIYLLPNLLTTAALFAGFYSIVAAVDGNFQVAGASIFVAMLMDGMDGRVARMTNTSTDFGKEFDSLSDMVSFGVAPAIVVYQWGVARLTEWHITWGRLGWLVAFLFTVAAAFRLARFNTLAATTDKRFFVGLPSPSAAGVVASFVWVSAKYELTGLPALVLAFLVTAVAGAMMVSRLRYYSFKDLNLTRRVSFTYLMVIPLIFMLISVDPPLVLFGLFSSFALSGPALWFWRKYRARRAAARESVDA